MSKCDLCRRLKENEPFRVLELYSGIGGTAFAIEGIKLALNIQLTSVEIHPVANTVHAANFPSSRILQRNINSLSVTECDELNASLWTMSPPCQPFTRQGLKKDVTDARCDSFIHLMGILPKMKNPPDYLFVENVKGFEESEARDVMMETTKNLGYTSKEYLLSPADLAIPNSRLRYYMTAFRNASESSDEMTLGLPLLLHPCPTCFQLFFPDRPTQLLSSDRPTQLLSSDRSTQLGGWRFRVRSLSEYLEPEVDLRFYLTEKELKFLQVMDVVDRHSTHSCCFTKSYSHLFMGTGSVLKTESERLRFFTPQEVSNLMSFPSRFKFPHQVSDRQKYKLLGNSVNVEVVSFILKCMFLMR